MPNSKSAIKNVRKNERRRLANLTVRSKARTAIKKARQLIQTGQLDEAKQAVQDAHSALDKAARKGVIHKNNAARRKSRLSQRLNQALQEQ